MGGSRREHFRAFVIALIVAIGVVSYVVGAGTPQLFIYKIPVFGTVGAGLYQSCLNIDDTGTCGEIKPDCSDPTFTKLASLFADFSIDIHSWCPHYNAMRAFVLVGVILGGAAILCLLMYSCTKHVRSQKAAHWLTIFASLAGIITMGLSISFHNKYLNGMDYGLSFGFIVGGWIVLLLIGTHMHLRG